MPQPPACCLCGEPCRPWHDPPTGYGHNPWPLSDNDEDRCCSDCNATTVLTARINNLIRKYH